MAGSDQIFANLKTHLQELISGKPAPVATPPAVAKVDPQNDTRAMLTMFQSEVPVKLRGMLELFKQPDSPRSRQNLSAICAELQGMGERFGLEHWAVMIKAVSAAVANPNNQFRVLAPILIKEIKQSQEQVLAQKASNIKVSSQLLQLVPEVAADITGTGGSTSADEVSKIFGAVIEEDKAMKGWQVFSEQVGWRQNGSWIASNAPVTNAPVGHFPTPLWLSSWHQSKDTKAKEFQAQYAAFLAKLASCDLS
jgi:hypothetical protein